MRTAYTAAAIYDAEAPALADGAPLMARAARAVADVVTDFAPAGAPITVFAGKGNNGADALLAAAHLASEGKEVAAVTVFDRSADLGATSAALTAATDAGVGILDGYDDGAVRRGAQAQVWVDGLSGIGMRPPVRGRLESVLAILTEEREQNHALPLVVGVDLPSGLNADSGAAPGPVIAADHTVTFGGYKAAQFLPPAAYSCGRLHLIDIGIAAEVARQPAAVHRVEQEDLRRWWPRPGPRDHKYTRGVVGMVTGSHDYPGAAALSVHGALATGPGMVRYLGQVPENVIHAHPEVIAQPDRVQAWVVGSGITGKTSGAGAQVTHAVTEAQRAGVPIVVDAGALEWVDGNEIAGLPVTSTVVLTPHAGELAGLLTRSGAKITRSEVDADPAHWAQVAAEMTGATVVLKGGTTLVVSEGNIFSQADGTPWMATAGSGDVLAGVLGSVLAGWQVQAEAENGNSWPTFGHAVASAVALHGRAGTRASGGGPIMASEIARAVSPTIRRLLAH